MFWAIIVLVLAGTILGFYLGNRIAKFKIEAIGSDHAYEELAGELRRTTLALGKAKDAYSDLEEGLGAIGDERDALVRQFSILRGVVGEFEYGIDGSDELADAGAILVEDVIIILEALAAIGIF